MELFTCHAAAFRRAREALADGRAVLVHGPAGIGTTTLARRAAVTVARGVEGGGVVRLAAAAPGSRPGAAFLGLVGADDLDRSPREAAARIAAALRARCASPVLVIDDAHDLGEASQRIVEELIRFAGPVRIVLTARPIEGRVPLLRRLLQDGLLESVPLRELERDELEGLVQRVLLPHPVSPEVVDLVDREVGGTPLLVVPYVESLRDGGALRLEDGRHVPGAGEPRDGALADAVDVLFRGIGDDTTALAELLSVTGRLDERTATTHASAAAADELRRTGLVHDEPAAGGHGLAFTRPAVGRAVLERLDPDRRRELVTRWRAGTGGLVPPHELDGADYERYLLLCLETGQDLSDDDVDRARRWARSSGRPALDVALVTHRLERDCTPDERADLLAGRLESAFELGRLGLVRADAERLRVLADADLLGPAARATAAERLAGLAQFADDDPAAAAAILVRAELDLDRIRAHEAARRVHVQRLAFGMYAGSVADLAEFSALRAADAEASARLLPGVAPELLLLAQTGDAAAARARLDRALRDTDGARAADVLLRNRAIVAGFEADLLLGAVARAERSAATHELQTADLRYVEVDAEEPLRSGRLALVDIARGHWDAAAQRLERTVAHLEGNDPYGAQARSLAHLALALAASGRADEALVAAGRARLRRRGAGRTTECADELVVLTAEAWCGIDVDGRLLELAERAGRRGLLLVELRTRHLRCHLRPRAALEEHDRIVELDSRLGLPLSSAVRTHTAEIAAGAARHSGVGARLLARLGVRLPISASLTQLTAREREVVGLVVLGFSSSAIAERLVTSKRTIDAHLGHVYVKLGISGRAQLASLVERADFEGLATPN